ncbi:hypothetical protein ACFQY8_02860 [Alloscardovia venturai]|uniref:Uncharacterized protein n=1 Tax=Alloscardovia venturai TaxID=1769421 RepID=A0ABW2Y7X5_9BIFI
MADLRHDNSDNGDSSNSTHQPEQQPASHESSWDIPNLDGIDFHRITSSATPSSSVSSNTSSSSRGTNYIEPVQDIEMTQSLAQLATNTSTNLKKVTPEDISQRYSSQASDTNNVEDPEATAAFDPLADDALMLPAQLPEDETPLQGSHEPQNQQELQDPQETQKLQTLPELPEESTFTSQFAALVSEDEGEAEGSHTHTNGRHTHTSSAGSSSNGVDRNTRRVLIWGIAGVLAVILIVALTIFIRHTATAATHEQLVNACVTSVKSAQSSSQELQKTINNADAEAKTSSDQVEDTSVLTNIQNAISQANASITKVNNLEKCSADLSDTQLKSITEDANSAISSQSTYQTTITKAKTAVSNSKNAKAVSTAKNELSAKRQEAQTLYTESQDKVADEATRDNLKKAIDSADNLLKQSTKSVTKDQYDDAKRTLNNTMTAVQNSQKAKAEADAKEREKDTDGICAPFAGSFSRGDTQFTLNGDCSITYGDDSSGSPSSCTFADGSTSTCASVDDEDNPQHINWSMQCTSDDNACKSGPVQLFASGLSNGGGDTSKTRISIGGQLFTKN